MRNNGNNPTKFNEETSIQPTCSRFYPATGFARCTCTRADSDESLTLVPRWEGKPWHGLSYELKRIFGKKTIKLSLDGGFTCPNRDGTLGTEGCSFCGADGSGSHVERAGAGLAGQIAHQQELLCTKWPDAGHIAYFQNFTGTYGALADLESRYCEVLNMPGIMGLAIATRPDCLGAETLALLERIKDKTFLWIELGLQTVHDATAEAFGRGYGFDCFVEAYAALKQRNIPTVVHLINGLPGETSEMMRQSAREVGRLQPWGMKLHLLHVIRGTRLAQSWENGQYTPMTKEEYVQLIADQLEIIPMVTTIHRLTGDGVAKSLLAPDWSRNKKGVLGAIEMEMNQRKTWQGKGLLQL